MLDVGEHRELQAAVLAMKAADRDLKRRINVATRETMNPVWRNVVTSHLAGADVWTSRVLGSGVRIAAGNPPRAAAATSTRNLGSQWNRGTASKTGRIVPADHYGMWEFGVNRMMFTRYERANPTRDVTSGRPSRRKPGTHIVERRVNMHAPRHTPKGRVVYPAFAEVAPRMVSLWTQLIVKSYFDAAEGI